MRKKLRKITPNIIIITLILLIVPTAIFIGLYKSTYDQRNKMVKMQAAIVNQDIPVKMSDKILPLGRELSGKIVSNKTGNYDWSVTNIKDATDGVETGKYVAMVVIPNDFSAKVSSAAATINSFSDNIKNATEQASSDGISEPTKSETDSMQENNQSDQIKTTSPSTEISQADIRVSVSDTARISEDEIVTLLIDTARSTFNSEYSASFLENVFIGFSTLGTQIDATKEKTDELFGGISELKDGGKELKTGGTQLSSGLETLGGGMDLFSYGLKEISSQSENIETASRVIDENAKILKTATEKLSSGTTKYKTGMERFNNSIVKLPDETQTTFATNMMKDDAKKINDILPWVKKQQLYFIDQYKNLCPTGTYSPECDTIAMAENVVNCILYGTDADCKKPATKTSFVGLTIFNQKLKSSTDFTVPLINAIPSIKDNVSTLTENSKTIASSAEKIAQANDKFEKGASKNANGIARFADGVRELDSNFGALNQGVGSSAYGAKELEKGIVKLSKGLSDVDKGSKQFSKSIEKLSSALPSLTETEEKQLASSIGTSVISPTVTGVSAYKDLPFIILLSLWLAALMLISVRRPLNINKLISSTKYSILLAIKFSILPVLFSIITSGIFTLIIRLSSVHPSLHECVKLFVALSISSCAFVLTINAFVALWNNVGKLLSLSLTVVLVSITILSPIFEPFMIISNFSPITPAINLLRYILVYNIFLLNPAIILIIWSIIAFIITIIACSLKRVLKIVINSKTIETPKPSFAYKKLPIKKTDQVFDTSSAEVATKKQLEKKLRISDKQDHGVFFKRIKNFKHKINIKTDSSSDIDNNNIDSGNIDANNIAIDNYEIENEIEQE